MSESDRLPQTMTRREFLKLIGASAGLAIAGGFLNACTPATAPTAASTIVPTLAPAKVSGTLTIYSALPKNIGEPIVAAFKSISPDANVSVSFSAAGDVQKKVIGEKAKPKADVLLGGASSFHDALRKVGLAEPYISPNAATVSASFKDANGAWTGWYVDVLSIAVNRARIAKEIGKPVSGWDDLLDAAWKGKLILPDPARTTAGYAFLATQVFRLNRDEDRAMEFMKALNQNVAQYVSTAAQGMQMIAKGQFIACPNWSADILTAKIKATAIDLIVPENVGLELGAMSIVKGAPNADAARAFVDWLFTKPAAELNVKLSNHLSTLADVAPPGGAPPLEQIKPVDYEYAWAIANKDRLIKKWQAAIK